jgi:hypothetical protein
VADVSAGVAGDIRVGVAPAGVLGTTVGTGGTVGTAVGVAEPARLQPARRKRVMRAAQEGQDQRRNASATADFLVGPYLVIGRDSTCDAATWEHS